jgi:hypothetical protein
MLVEIAHAALVKVAGAQVPVTIRLPSGIVLETAVDTDPVWLGALVRNLGAASA